VKSFCNNSSIRGKTLHVNSFIAKKFHNRFDPESILENLPQDDASDCKFSSNSGESMPEKKNDDDKTNIVLDATFECRERHVSEVKQNKI